MSDPRLLHIYWLDAKGGECFIVGNRAGLLVLRHAIQTAIESDKSVGEQVTAADADWLAGFTRALVAERLAACGHHVSPIRSVSRWEGALDVERAKRVLDGGIKGAEGAEEAATPGAEVPAQAAKEPVTEAS